MHGVTALIKFGESRNVCTEIVLQRLDDDVALLTQSSLFVVFIETDGTVKIFELLLHCWHLVIPFIK